MGTQGFMTSSLGDPHMRSTAFEGQQKLCHELPLRARVRVSGGDGRVSWVFPHLIVCCGGGGFGNCESHLGYRSELPGEVLIF